jgi:hypothetical protein
LDLHVVLSNQLSEEWRHAVQLCFLGPPLSISGTLHREGLVAHREQRFFKYCCKKGCPWACPSRIQGSTSCLQMRVIHQEVVRTCHGLIGPVSPLRFASAVSSIGEQHCMALLQRQSHWGSVNLRQEDEMGDPTLAKTKIPEGST